MSRTLSEWLDWQESLHLSSIDLGLDRVGKVALHLALSSLPMPVITVAGTNGKGSSVTMLDSIYREAGYQTGCYISPHLIRYNERISIHGQPASDEDICEAFEAIDQARDDISLTYFEFGTLAAAYLFNKYQIDVAIFEVGLGGRLDAVNLWDADLALISNIDIDHIDWLGDDREQIGVEKAGIMRKGKTVVSGDPNPTLSIQSEAERIGASLLQLGRDYQWHPGETDDIWYLTATGSGSLVLPKPSLRGKFQLNNASMVITAIKSFCDQLPVNDDSIRQGLTKARVIGRLQKLGECPELLVDVAHNPQSAQALADYLSENPTSGKTVALFSALADKDLEGILEPLRNSFEAWHIVPLDGPRAQDTQQLLEKIQRYGVNGTLETHSDFNVAIKMLQNTLNCEDRLVAFGSFLVVSGFMQGLTTPE
ncbi:bifunctional tetrahydrofolate synthase/dihydrofolate synthase [Leucothrix pacifica]|uniref:Dihydrofolate synthase/folylpolyglutamate synthase n=1 Tax=Leucothrix pacifica TaxID=1247513 RepID=A0A317C942_9GAMM|nr:bifunctional tetrahydrofolate synthase/dihydrofolate synthase [Leucothrix pacifica]PWQ92870.1 bifunctional tetrahydrofolate synthase/dihydrofolate synthase [Leucothrix pacifica]